MNDVEILAAINNLRLAMLNVDQPKTIIDNWIPRSQVKSFFSYGDTQMAALEADPILKVAKVGKRKFIRKDSLLKLLEENIISHTHGTDDIKPVRP